MLSKADINVKAYTNLLSSLGFHPCVNKPIRVNKSSATINDHIWTKCYDLVYKSGILLTDVSDHFSPFIFCKGKTDTTKQLSFSYRDYNKLNKNYLCALIKHKIDRLNFSADPDTVYEAVTNTIIDVVHEGVPLKTVKITCKSQRKPWITPELSRKDTPFTEST